MEEIKRKIDNRIHSLSEKYFDEFVNIRLSREMLREYQEWIKSEVEKKYIRKYNAKPADGLLHKVADYYELTLDEIKMGKSRFPIITKARRAFVYIGRIAGFDTATLAEAINVTGAGIYIITKKTDELLEDGPWADKQFQSDIEELEKLFNQ
jgi:hypothetical protein